MSPPSTPSTGRGAAVGLLGTVMAFAVVLLGLWWILAPDAFVLSMGSAEAVVSRPGAPSLLVRSLGSWKVLPDAAIHTDDALPLPEQTRGRPYFDAAGRVHALLESELVVVEGGQVTSRVETPAAGPAAELRLAGVDAADEPVLLVGETDGTSLWVRREGAWVVLEDGSGARARPPLASPVILGRTRPVLAFLGLEGWETWAYEEAEAVRSVARDCRGATALFVPDETALVVDGRTDGLFRLYVADGTMAFMAEGNLGGSDRVPAGHGFRGDPTMLVAPQWFRGGHLQLIQTHLSGGGRLAFTTGFTHHYAPAVSGDGRWLAYIQGDFDPEGRDEFREELYLFDFARPERAAVLLAGRWGGRPHQGPVFTGDGQAVVFVVDGLLQRYDLSESE